MIASTRSACQLHSRSESAHVRCFFRLGWAATLALTLALAPALGCGNTPSSSSSGAVARVSEALTIQGGANTLVTGLGGVLGFGTLDLVASDATTGSFGSLNAAGGAPVLLGSGDLDDGFWQVDLASVFPNGINFFGIHYTTMFIGTNGYVTFGAGSAGFSPSGIQFSKRPMIAAQYNDLYYSNAVGNKVGSLFLSYDTTVADPVVTLTFYDVLECCSVSASRNRFQIRIHNTGGGTALTGDDFAAEVRYNQLQFGGSGSVAGFADGTSTGGNGETGTVATTRFGTLAPACLSPNFLLNASNAACTNRTPGVAGVYVWTSHSPAAVAANAGGGQSANVGAAFATALTARVTDLSGAALAGATVTFTCPASGASCTVSDGEVSGTSATVVTNASGLASVTATANATAGAYSVSAGVTGVVTAAAFALTNTAVLATSIAVNGGSGQQAIVASPFATALSVIVTNASSVPVAGVVVNFVAPASGARATLSAASATTNASGIATITATAGTVAGAYNVTATVSATALSTTLALVNLTGPPASITVTSGDEQSVMAGAAFPIALAVLVRDASSNLVSGATVNFVAPLTGATAIVSAPSATTTAGGAASVTATAGAVAGAYSVTATVNGTGLSTNISLANTPGAPASLIILTGNGQTATVGTPFAMPLAVAVADAGGNPIPGATVLFIVPGSGASAMVGAGSAITGVTGQAAVIAAANSVVGSYPVTVSVMGTGLSLALELTNGPGAPASITVLTGSGQSVTAGAPFTTPLSALVRDASSNPIPGATVNFTAPIGGASATLSTPSATTSSGGAAAVLATAGTVAGAYSVTATVNGTALSTTFALSNQPGGPAQLTVLTGNAQSATVGAPFATPLAVVVTDSHGNAVSGATVVFGAPASGASAVLAPASSTTASTGRAAVNATANSIAGGYSVSATVMGTSLSRTLTLTNNPGAAASITVLTGSGQSAVAGTPFATSLAAQVRDANDNPVPGAIINFTSPPTGATATLSALLATTDSAGTAGITATAGAIAGTYPITATVGSTSLATTFTVTNGAGAPATIAFSGEGSTQHTIVGTPFALPLAVIVRDSLGNGVPNVTVTLTVPSTGATAALGGGTAVTGSNGIASVSASAGTVTGDYSVGAAITGGLSVSFSLSNRPDAPASIAVANGSSPQSAQVNGALGQPLGVTVTDQFGNGVPSTSVAFSAPSSGASLTLSGPTAVTNAGGQASVTATVNTTPGTFGVTAIVTGTSLTASFTITNSPGAPANIRIASGSPQSTTVGLSTGLPLTVVVTDAFGNPVPSAQVAFDAPGTGATAALGAITGTTDSAGTASVTATANTRSGHYLVSASVEGGGAPVSFDLTNTPDAPATITAALTATPQAARVATSYTNSLGATVRDRYGNLIPGVTVSYAVLGTGATVTLETTSATTDESGSASVAATAGTIAGAVTVTARVAPLVTPATFSLTNLPGAPSALVADSGAGQDAVVATAFALRLGARLRDGFGNAVPGSTVTFTAPTTGATATFDSATAVTDANGLATVGVTAGTMASTTSYSVLATTAGAAAPAAYLLRNLPGAPASIQPIGTATPQSTTVATAFAGALEVLVEDTYGNAAPLATVTFTAATAPGATATLSATSVATNAAGHAEVNATASSTTGSYAVTASVAGAASPARFNLTNLADAPSSVSVTAGSPQAAPVATAFPAALAVIVRDQFGNGAPEVTVTFAAPDHGASAALDTTTAITDSTGKAHVTAHAGQITGGYTVTASAPGAAAPALLALTNNPGQPSRLKTVSGDGQHTMASAPFGAPLVVGVADTFDNPVPGATVSFSAPTNGASAGLSVASAVTNGQGQAQVTSTANRKLGAYNVSATVSGVATAATFALTNDAIQTTLTLTADTTTPSSHQTMNLLVTLSSPLGVPTGNVHIIIDGAPAFDVTPHDGATQVPYRVGSLGAHTFLAQYDGEESFGAATSAVLEVIVKNDAGSIGGGGCAVLPGAPPAADIWFIALAGFGARWLLRRRPRSRRDARRLDLERGK